MGSSGWRCTSRASRTSSTSTSTARGRVTYGDVFLQAEQEYSAFNFELADTEMLFRHFADAETRVPACILERRPARCRPTTSASRPRHLFNLLDARGVISVTERQAYIGRVRDAGEGLLPRLARRAAATGRRSRPMAELLLELFSEEIPARMQDRAAEDLPAPDRPSWLKRRARVRRRSQAFATPRRLTLVVDGLPARQADRTSRAQGPARRRAGAGARGFLRASAGARPHARGARGQEGPGSVRADRASPAGRPRDVLAELVPEHPGPLPVAEIDALG